MSDRGNIQEIYRLKEESRELRAKRPIAEKLAIAEELRDLQKALVPIREANRAKVRETRRPGSNRTKD